LKDSVGVEQNVAIQESQHTEPKPQQVAAAPAVLLLLPSYGVLAAVQLDDPALLQATEIRVEGPDRMLAPKLVAAELAGAQSSPEARLRASLEAAQLSRACSEMPLESRHTR
jgi:hypothetical protein